LTFLEQYDADLLAKAVSRTVGDVVYYATVDAGQAVPFAGAHDDPGRAARVARTFRAGITPLAVLEYLGLLVLDVARMEAYRVAGAAIGAAIGAALFPAGGAVIGTVISVVALPLLGQIVFHAITVDIPLSYRLHRLARLYRQVAGAGNDALAATIAAVEDKLLEGVDRGLAHQDFGYFDKLVSRLAKLDPADLTLYTPLLRRIESKLAFAITADRDWVAARKYYQMLQALHLTPESPLPH